MRKPLAVFVLGVVLATLVSGGSPARNAHAEERVLLADSYRLHNTKWEAGRVDVRYNWAETVCESSYTNPNGNATPSVPASAATQALQRVISDLNAALDGGLVLVDAGQGPARGHCGTGSEGTISVGWSPLVTAGAARWSSGFFGEIESATVMLDASPPWGDAGSVCGHTDTYRLLRHVLMHEIMHALGVAHSEVAAAVMAPSHSWCDANAILHADDLAALRAHYPPSATAPKPATTPRPPSTPAQALGRMGIAITAADTTVDGLLPVLAIEGCIARVLAITINGRMHSYIVGAPAFVNAAFPTPLAAGTPYIYRCAA